MYVNDNVKLLFTQVINVLSDNTLYFVILGFDISYITETLNLIKQNISTSNVFQN